MIEYIMCRSEKETIEVSKLLINEKYIFAVGCGTVHSSEKYTHFLEVKYDLPSTIYKFCAKNGIDYKRLCFLEGKVRD